MHQQMADVQSYSFLPPPEQHNIQHGTPQHSAQHTPQQHEGAHEQITTVAVLEPPVVKRQPPSNRRVQCPCCDKHPMRKDLSRHVERCHKDFYNSVNNITNNGKVEKLTMKTLPFSEQRVPCPRCQKLPMRKDLLRHVQRCHKDIYVSVVNNPNFKLPKCAQLKIEPQKPVKQKKPSPCERRVSCPYCHKLPMKKDLSVHIERCHKEVSQATREDFLKSLKFKDVSDLSQTF